MDNVVIVESPAKAKTINKYLGSDYKVLASFGHIRDLPSKDGSVKPDEEFSMLWEVSEGAEKRIKDIISALKGAKQLILASDPDREGEAIAWHVIDELGKRGKLKGIDVGRVTFNEITKSTVTEAIKHPREIDKELVDAYLARRALDYLVGFSLSPVLWRKLPNSKSAGRVQSVALRLICERENEIEDFKPEEYWTIKGLFKNAENLDFSALLTMLEGEKLDKFTINTAQKAEKAKEILLKHKYSVGDLEEKKVSRNPAPPFTTSTLQQEAARKLYMPTKKTMQIAQGLYEGVEYQGETVGLITYMRTDGVQIANEAVNACRAFIEKDFGEKYMPAKPRFYKNNVKNAQEAHEAIRPTDIFKTPKMVAPYLTNDQLKLYKLIWERTVASQMESAVFNRIVATLSSEDKKSAFRASGQTMLFDGFLKLYFEDTDDKQDAEGDENALLPNLQRGDDVGLIDIAPSQHFTQSPPRYSEASLVKKLEELGIGRPSTYASIISVLQDRDYVRLESRRFIPEDKGRIVTVFLENFFNRYVEYDFTANLEDLLDDISQGKIAWKKVLSDFWLTFKEHIDKAESLSFSEVMDRLNEVIGGHVFPNPEDKICPECHKGTLSIRLGKNNPFIGCSLYPECGYTRPLSNKVIMGEGGESVVEEPKIKELGVADDGQKITLRKGPYGYYVQLGEVAKASKAKTKVKSGKALKTEIDETQDSVSKRVGLLKGMKPEEVGLDTALALLSLPRKLGTSSEGEVIEAGVGRYGPYVKKGSLFVSLGKDDDVLKLSLDRALELLSKKPVAKADIIGKHPETGEDICYGKGRFGPYVKRGKIYASLPKAMQENGEIPSLEEALKLLEEKENNASSKTAPARKSVRKTASKAKVATKKKN